MFTVPLGKHQKTILDIIHVYCEVFFALQMIPGVPRVPVQDMFLYMNFTEWTEFLREAATYLHMLHTIFITPHIGPLEIDLDSYIFVERLFAELPFVTDSELGPYMKELEGAYNGTTKRMTRGRRRQRGGSRFDDMNRTQLLAEYEKLSDFRKKMFNLVNGNASTLPDVILKRGLNFIESQPDVDTTAATATATTPRPPLPLPGRSSTGGAAAPTAAPTAAAAAATPRLTLPGRSFAGGGAAAPTAAAAETATATTPRLPLPGRSSARGGAAAPSLSVSPLPSAAAAAAATAHIPVGQSNQDQPRTTLEFAAPIPHTKPRAPAGRSEGAGGAAPTATASRAAATAPPTTTADAAAAAAATAPRAPANAPRAPATAPIAAAAAAAAAAAQQRELRRRLRLTDLAARAARAAAANSDRHPGGNNESGISSDNNSGSSGSGGTGRTGSTASSATSVNSNLYLPNIPKSELDKYDEAEATRAAAKAAPGFAAAAAAAKADKAAKAADTAEKTRALNEEEEELVLAEREIGLKGRRAVVSAKKVDAMKVQQTADLNESFLKLANPGGILNPETIQSVLKGLKNQFNKEIRKLTKIKLSFEDSNTFNLESTQYESLELFTQSYVGKFVNYLSEIKRKYRYNTVVKIDSAAYVKPITYLFRLQELGSAAFVMGATGKGYIHSSNIYGFFASRYESLMAPFRPNNYVPPSAAAAAAGAASATPSPTPAPTPAPTSSSEYSANDMTSWWAWGRSFLDPTLAAARKGYQEVASQKAAAAGMVYAATGSTVKDLVTPDSCSNALMTVGSILATSSRLYEMTYPDEPKRLFNKHRAELKKQTRLQFESIFTRQITQYKQCFVHAIRRIILQLKPPAEYSADSYGRYLLNQGINVRTITANGSGKSPPERLQERMATIITEKMSEIISNPDFGTILDELYGVSGEESIGAKLQDEFPSVATAVDAAVASIERAASERASIQNASSSEAIGNMISTITGITSEAASLVAATHIGVMSKVVEDRNLLWDRLSRAGAAATALAATAGGAMIGGPPGGAIGAAIGSAITGVTASSSNVIGAVGQMRTKPTLIERLQSRAATATLRAQRAQAQHEQARAAAATAALTTPPPARGGRGGGRGGGKNGMERTTRRSKQLRNQTRRYK